MLDTRICSQCQAKAQGPRRRDPGRRGAAEAKGLTSPRNTRRRSHKAFYIPVFSLSFSRELWLDCSLSVPESEQ